MEASATAWGMTESAARRTVRVETNRTCNQGCAFCDRREPAEDRAFIHPAAVRRRIDRARESDAEVTVLLTGGEPARRRDLPALVAYAAESGPVALETNATLIEEPLAASLRQAGLAYARVHLPGHGAAHDDVTRDPGGFERMLAGLEALRAAGCPLEFATPIVRANETHIAELPAWIAAQFPEARTWWLLAPHAGGEDDAVLPLEHAARALEAAEAAARREGIEVQLDPHTHVPPCLFEHPARVAHLYALTRGGRHRAGYAQRTSCEGCVVADRCPGFPRRGHSVADSAPLREDRVRRRLSVISSVREQIARELVQDEVTRPAGGEARLARTVRIRFGCNQACSFCFVSTHLPAPPADHVRAAIVEAAQEGALVVLSGGEPTLHPELPALVRLAKESGAREVEVQTNAIRATPELAAALSEAGLDVAHVSLHAADAATSDAITGAPGTFDKTLRGLDALHAEHRVSGLGLRLSFVFCQSNVGSFVPLIELVAERWPGASIAVSFVAPSTDMVPRTRALVPRHSDVLPALAEGVARAADLGVRLSGFESMCGLPLCLVPNSLIELPGLAELPADYMEGERADAEACQRCAWSDRCFGVRRGYAELWGTDELRPIVKKR